ncbi:MAG: amidase [Spirochaetes bacterium RBG_16_49_21]|nr:MAG: amidase [Spirochaetes bacterium RBG_16_49_21]
MSLSDEVKNHDATSLAHLVRTKEVKPLELVEAAIERIEKLNPTLNAVVTTMYDQARDVAGSKIPEGPFSGVPFLLKDMIASYAGVRLSFGSRLLKNYVPDYDSELVRRYKKAGLIIIGKTNTPEFGILPTTEPELFGPTKNPWSTNCSTGGSSGGSAAAVAAGIVPMAHGNDGGGSIRIPASICGVFGLKPTRARNTLAPDLGDIMGGLVSEHALTRTVRDSAALLDATAGCVLGDPYWAPPIVRPFREEAGIDPGRLRIAFTTDTMTGVPVHDDCVNAVKDAALLCQKLGHVLEEAAPVVDGIALARAFVVKWAAGVAAIIKALGARQDQVEPLTWGMYELGRSNDAADYLNAEQTLQHAARDIAAFFLKYDILLTPTLAQPPVQLGSFDSTPDNPLNGFRLAGEIAAFTPLYNATGQPAMSVPLYWNAGGLPIGTHFIGRFGDEATLFRLASQLEETRPWKNRRPPVSV